MPATGEHCHKVRTAVREDFTKQTQLLVTPIARIHGGGGVVDERLHGCSLVGINDTNHAEPQKRERRHLAADGC